MIFGLNDLAAAAGKPKPGRIFTSRRDKLLQAAGKPS